MPQLQPTLPTTLAVVVQLRVQPTGAPLGWDGRVEYGVSGQVTPFQALEALWACRHTRGRGACDGCGRSRGGHRWSLTPLHHRTTTIGIPPREQGESHDQTCTLFAGVP